MRGPLAKYKVNKLLPLATGILDFLLAERDLDGLKL